MHDSARLRNFTPHDIHLHLPDGDVMVVPSEGVARIVEQRELLGHVGGVPVHGLLLTGVAGLPPAEPSTYVIVSSVVLWAQHGRDDLLAPDTGAGAVRDSAGRITGTRGFVRALPD